MNKVFRRSVMCAAVSAALLLSGCATHSDKLGFADGEGTKTYAAAYEPARQMLLDGRWDDLRNMLNQNTSREVKEEQKTESGEIRQTVRTEKLTNDEEMERMLKEQSELSIIERGLMTLNSGDFERALFYFDAAEEKLGLAEADDSVSSAVSSAGKTGLAVILGAEEMANYELRGYEKVMLLNYKALCYMLMGDRKAYNVTRRAIDLQQAEWEKFKELLAQNEKKQQEMKKEVGERSGEQNNIPTEEQATANMNKLLSAFGGHNQAQAKKKLSDMSQLMGAVGPSPENLSIADIDDRSNEVKAKAQTVSSAYVNPFGDYLNAMMMEIDGFDDRTMRQNARIAYKKVVENNQDCSAAKQAVRNVEKGVGKNQKLVQILLSDGFSPYQVEKTKIFPVQLEKRKDLLNNN